MSLCNGYAVPRPFAGASLSRRNCVFESIRWNDGKGTVYGVAIGDLDGDTWPDLAVARSEAPNAIWFNGPAVR